MREKSLISSIGRSPTTMSAPPDSTGSDEVGDRRTLVLVVGIGVHDHVGAGSEAGVESGHERRREPTVASVRHDVVDTQLAGDLDGAVGAAVVDHEPLDESTPGNSRGRSASVIGSVASSLKHGIWMISLATLAPAVACVGAPGFDITAQRNGRA